MKENIILALFLTVVLPATVCADAIFLKNGKVIEGKIISEKKYSVKIEVNDFPYTYYLDEIERIEKDGVGPAPVKAGTPMRNRTASAIVADLGRDLTIRLLEANGTRARLTGIFNQAIATAPARIQPQLRKIMVADYIIERMIPIYTREFNPKELKDLVTFYTSSAGKKYHEKSPELMKLMMEETVKYFNEKVKALSQ